MTYQQACNEYLKWRNSQLVPTGSWASEGEYEAFAGEQLRRRMWLASFDGDTPVGPLNEFVYAPAIPGPGKPY